MKRIRILNLTMAMIILAAGSAFADAQSTAKKTGEDVGEAAVTAKDATVKGVKTGAGATADASKKAANATVDGAEVARDKTVQGVQTGAEATAKAGEVASRETRKAASVTKTKTVEGAEVTKETTVHVAGEVGGATKKGLSAIGEGLKKVGSTTENAVEGAKEGASGKKH